MSVRLPFHIVVKSSFFKQGSLAIKLLSANQTLLYLATLPHCVVRGENKLNRAEMQIFPRGGEREAAPRNINLPPNFYLPSCCRCSIANSTGGAQWRKEQTGTWPFQIAVSLNILQGPIRNSILHQTAVNEPSCIVQDLFK